MYKQSFAECVSNATVHLQVFEGRTQCGLGGGRDMYNTSYEQRDSFKCIFHYFGGLVFVGQRGGRGGGRQEREKVGTGTTVMKSSGYTLSG